MLRWLFKIVGNEQHKCQPCEQKISPALAEIKSSLNGMNKRIDDLFATINGDPKWFLTMHKGDRHDNT